MEDMPRPDADGGDVGGADAAFAMTLKARAQAAGGGQSAAASSSSANGAAAGAGAGVVFAFLEKKLLIFGCCCWRFIFRTF